MTVKISTSALAKKHGLSPKELFQRFESASFLQRKNDSWQLTNAGKAAGGELKKHAKYGEYVAWPEGFTIDKIDSVASSAAKAISATQVGKHFGISANKINFIFSELGWLEKALKGWKATAQGLRVGGVQKEDHRSGIPYVAWPDSIIENKTLSNTISEVLGNKLDEQPVEESDSNFREKFEAKNRATDGHYVRSRAEMLIDNWLYMAEIVHAYERRLPIEEEMYCDFYLPGGKVYIEFWGLENEPRYLARKQAKKDLYHKYGFNLIELNDDDVLNLDDVLPKRLLKFGIQAY